MGASEGFVRTMRAILRLLGFIFATGAIVFVVAAAVLGAVIWKYEQDLPDYSQLKNYEPPVMTRVHAADGSLLAEYSRERRLYLPVLRDSRSGQGSLHLRRGQELLLATAASTPKASCAPASCSLQGSRHVQGASTITQQVAKNFLLNSDRTFDRKIREILLSVRIESAYSKEKILELYLNEIYLGLSNYGVAAAALNYFDKSVHELTIAEVAYLAALPKEPSALNPFRNHDRAVERRNYVIGRMAEDGYITAEQARAGARRAARRQSARADARHRSPPASSPRRCGASSASATARRSSTRAAFRSAPRSIPKMQLMARKALVDGLVRYDEAHGWHGALKTIDLGQDWGVPLADIPAYGDIKPWQLAVALDVSGPSIRIGLQPEHDKSGAVVQDRADRRRSRPTAIAGPAGRPSRWRSRATSSMSNRWRASVGEYRLRQIPEVSGACVAMDPFTGRVLAMVGGFSFDESEFNRATQAQRQPGSSFKPFVYATALDNGYTPSSLILDAPMQIDEGSGRDLDAGELRGQVRRPAHAALRHRALDQPDDRAPRPRHRHAADRRIRQALRRLRQPAAVPVDVARRRRDHGAAHGHRLFDVRQRRQADQADADRPHPGPLGQHDLQARRAHLRGLRRRQMGQPGRADADRQARAGDRPA